MLTATALVAAAALSAHVAAPADLPTARFTSGPRTTTLAAFGRAHDKSEAALRRAGYRTVAESAFRIGSPSNGFSIAAGMASAAAAEREAARLYRANSDVDPGLTARALPVPGVPGAKATLISGREDGIALRAIEVVWSRGAVLHELFVIGRASRISARAITRGVARIDARTGGA